MALTGLCAMDNRAYDGIGQRGRHLLFMCRSSAELGGPRRCGSDARDRLTRSLHAVDELEHRRCVIEVAVQHRQGSGEAVSQEGQPGAGVVTADRAGADIVDRYGDRMSGSDSTDWSGLSKGSVELSRDRGHRRGKCLLAITRCAGNWQSVRAGQCLMMPVRGY